MTLSRLLGFVSAADAHRRSFLAGLWLCGWLAMPQLALAQQAGEPVDPGQAQPGQAPAYPQYPPGYAPYPAPGYQQMPPQAYQQNPQVGYPPPGTAPGSPSPQGGQPYPQYPAQAYPPSAYPPGAQPYPQYPPPGGAQPPAGYPGYPSGYPAGYPPTQAPYPPNAVYPPGPAAAPAPAAVRPPATPAAPTEPAKLVLTAGSDEAKAALWACLEAVENYRAEQARLRCGDAVAKDSQLALAHVLLAQVAPTAAVAKKRISEANDLLARRPLPELERLLAEALLAQLEDRRPAALAALDALVGSLPGDKRAYHYRGLWRYRSGQLDGAQADFERATGLDSKYGPAWNALGHLHIRRDKLDEAQKAFEKYIEAAPKEANAYDSLASLQLRRGSLGPAVEHARKALELDGKFLKANARLGDALLFQGNPVAARRAYAGLMASADPAEHHDGAMRSARSHVFEAQGAPTARLFQNAEKELQAEADLARKLDRRADQLHALTELCRMQIERGALGDAGHTIQSARELVDDAAKKGAVAAADKPAASDADAAKVVDKSAPTLSSEERQRYQTELLVLRALLLGSVGESSLAEERADELEKLWRGPAGLARARELRGDLAARSGDREGVVKLLDPTVTSDGGKTTTTSLRPLSRLALGFALGGGKPGEQMDTARARGLMDELAKRNINDLEGALTRGRARAWLKQNPADKNEKSEAKTDKAP